MPVAGVMAARERLFNEGFGGVVLDDDDYTEQAKTPGVVVRVRGARTAKATRVPLPERFRAKGNHQNKKKHESTGDREDLVVEGKPRSSVTSSGRRQSLPPGAQRMPGASTAPQATETSGSVVGVDGVVMGRPPMIANLRGPLHRYLSDSLGREVRAIYYKKRRTDAEAFGSDGGVVAEVQLEEMPEGNSNYPFVAGMELFVEFEGDAPVIGSAKPQKPGCLVM